MNALTLPDIAAQTLIHQQALDWVGMTEVALPVFMGNQPLQTMAEIGVSLDDPTARGIHMSRLYLALGELANKELSTQQLQAVLQQFLTTHQGLTQQASLVLRGNLLLDRPALVSPLSGWKAYPVELHSTLDEHQFRLELRVDIGYSSTCPCSAALARQLIQQQFQQDFADRPLQLDDVTRWLGSSQGILATPHSQRSKAIVQVRLHESSGIPALELIETTEAALGTALQTAVKRADEQAFALANGQNLMFCEDAARQLHAALAKGQHWQAFKIEVVHSESLHAHNAVARSSRGWS